MKMDAVIGVFVSEDSCEKRVSVPLATEMRFSTVTPPPLDGATRAADERASRRTRAARDPNIGLLPPTG